MNHFMKKPKKTLAIVGGIAVLVILAVFIQNIVSEQNAKRQQYNEGLTQLNSQDYQGALQSFTALGDFDDAEQKAVTAKLELDYLKVEPLIAAKDFDQAGEILQARSAFFGDSDKGKAASALAKECSDLSAAFVAKEAGNFGQAADLFEGLNTLKASYAVERNQCRLKAAEQNEAWMDVLLQLYALQTQDADLRFQKDPQNEDEKKLAEAYALGQYELFNERIDEADLEHKALKERAVNELRYAAAIKLFEEQQYAKATEILEVLGDYKDSPSYAQRAAKELRYAAAIELFETEQYAKAEKRFKELADFRDAESYADLSAKGLRYESAIELFEAAKYSQAAKRFKALGDFKESESYWERAETGKRYVAAIGLYEDSKYAEAAKRFEELGDYQDSESYLAKALQNKENAKIYGQAEDYYNNGEYYKAKKLFDSIPEFKDAKRRSEKCKRPLPENGSLKSGNGTSVSITIKAPGGDESVYVKVYNASGSLAGTVFLRPDGKSTLRFKSGTYTIKVAYGTTWYGKTDLFGPNGSYSQLLNGSSKKFKLSKGFAYTLKLYTSTDGNVGSDSLGGPGDM